MPHHLLGLYILKIKVEFVSVGLKFLLITIIFIIAYLTAIKDNLLYNMNYLQAYYAVYQSCQTIIP